MRDLDPGREDAFFALFKDYFDLERDAGKQHDSANYGIERLFPLAELAGNPERKLKIIHVAGTKGKGSTCYFIAALLNAAGRRCGCFSSPHLDTVRERFQLDGRLAGYSELEAVAQPLCRKLRMAGLHPSLFEIFTVLALKLFADAGMEYAVLETGIGGTLDATNYVDGKSLTVITALSYDHTALLGNTMREIAAQKAGILRPAVPVVLAPQPFAEAEQEVRLAAHSIGAPVVSPVPAAECPEWLPAGSAPYLRENFRTAFTALRQLGIVPERKAFAVPQLRARFERICENPLVIIDAAHNGDSARRLTQAVQSCYPGLHFLCVLGCVPGKDVTRIAEQLSAMDAEFILTDPDTPRGSALPQLVAAAAAAGLRVRAVIPHLDSSAVLPADMPLLFTGSFFTALIGEKLFGSAGTAG